MTTFSMAAPPRRELGLTPRFSGRGGRRTQARSLSDSAGVGDRPITRLDLMCDRTGGRPHVGMGNLRNGRASAGQGWWRASAATSLGAAKRQLTVMVMTALCEALYLEVPVKTTSYCSFWPFFVPGTTENDTVPFVPVVLVPTSANFLVP